MKYFVTALLALTFATSAHAETLYKFKEEYSDGFKVCYYKSYSSGRSAQIRVPVVVPVVSQETNCPYTIEG